MKNAVQIFITIILIGFAVWRIADLTSTIDQYDLVQYWSAAQIFWNSINPLSINPLFANPYDTTAMLHFQRAVASHITTSASIFYLPPWSLTLLWPLSLIDYETTRIVWLLLTVTCFGTISLYLIRTVRSSISQVNLLLIITLLLVFIPFYSTIFYGQISWLLLLGWFGFLILLPYSAFTAGLVLALTLIKPHLLYLIYFYFILNIADKRVRQILAGLMLGGIAFCLPVLIYNTQIFEWYINFRKHPPIFWQTPNLGSWLQDLTDVHTFAIRAVPSVLFAIGLVIYKLINKNRARTLTDFKTILLLLLPISLVSAPYGWIYDASLLLPSIFLLCFKTEQGRPVFQVLVAAGFIIAGLIYGLLPTQVGQHWFIFYTALCAILCTLRLISYYRLSSASSSNSDCSG